MEPKKLYRSVKNRMLCGVCGGLGEYFNVDPMLIRLLVAIIAVMKMHLLIPIALVYLLAVAIIPQK